MMIRLALRALFPRRSREIEAKVDAFRFRYLDFTPLAARSGLNIGLGVSWTP